MILIDILKYSDFMIQPEKLFVMFDTQYTINQEFIPDGFIINTMFNPRNIALLMVCTMNSFYILNYIKY